MSKFRKKPVVIEAVRCAEVWQAIKDNADLPMWLTTAYVNGDIKLLDNGLSIVTLEGVMFAPPASWIICGVNGEIYPCQPDIFDKTYEAVVP